MAIDYQFSDSERDSFRTSLKELVVIAQRVGPLCSGLEGLVSVLELGVENDDQLHLLMRLVQKGGPEKRQSR